MNNESPNIPYSEWSYSRKKPKTMLKFMELLSILAVTISIEVLLKNYFAHTHAQSTLIFLAIAKVVLAFGVGFFFWSLMDSRLNGYIAYSVAFTITSMLEFIVLTLTKAKVAAHTSILPSNHNSHIVDEIALFYLAIVIIHFLFMLFNTDLRGDWKISTLANAVPLFLFASLFWPIAILRLALGVGMY